MSDDSAQQWQNDLQQTKANIYFSYSLNICLEIPLSFAYLYFAYRGFTYFRANSFTFLLLLLNGLALFLYSSSTFGLLITAKRLIEASPDDLTEAYNNYRTVTRVNWWMGIYAGSCYNVSHWIFAFKYWVVSMKLEWLKTGQDPNKYNNWFLIVLTVGVLANCLSDLFFQFSISHQISDDLKLKRLAIADLSFQPALYVSWIVLCDAFRRFSKSKTNEQVINNTKVFFMLFSYLIYAVGVTWVTATQLHNANLKINDRHPTKKEDLNVFYGYDFIFFAFSLSDLVLLVVLYQLMVAERNQNQPNDFDSYPRDSKRSSFQPRSSYTQLSPKSQASNSVNSEEMMRDGNSVYSDADHAILTTVLQKRTYSMNDA